MCLITFKTVRCTGCKKQQADETRASCSLSTDGSCQNIRTHWLAERSITCEACLSAPLTEHGIDDWSLLMSTHIQTEIEPPCYTAGADELPAYEAAVGDCPPQYIGITTLEERDISRGWKGHFRSASRTLGIHLCIPAFAGENWMD